MGYSFPLSCPAPDTKYLQNNYWWMDYPCPSIGNVIRLTWKYQFTYNRWASFSFLTGDLRFIFYFIWLYGRWAMPCLLKQGNWGLFTQGLFAKGWAGFWGRQRRVMQFSKSWSLRGLSSPLCLKRHRGKGAGTRLQRERELNGEDQLARAMVGHWVKKTIWEKQVDDHLGLFLLPLHLPPLLLLAEGDWKPRHTGSLTAVLKSVFWTQIRCREVRVHKTGPVPV